MSESYLVEAFQALTRKAFEYRQTSNRIADAYGEQSVGARIWESLARIMENAVEETYKLLRSEGFLSEGTG